MALMEERTADERCPQMDLLRCDGPGPISDSALIHGEECMGAKETIAVENAHMPQRSLDKARLPDGAAKRVPADSRGVKSIMLGVVFRARSRLYVPR